MEQEPVVTKRCKAGQLDAPQAVRLLVKFDQDSAP